jgi:hypothetical protein
MRLNLNDLQDHLYDSFLHGSASDITIYVVGTWEAHYRLHRVVLTQAVRLSCLRRLCWNLILDSLQGFFNSLFTSGFRESSQKHSSNFITLELPDFNISRAGESL